MHRAHDLTIYIYRGNGFMVAGTNQLSVVAGDVIFVPKGLPHRFENTGNSPAIAIVAFTPALLGEDFEPIEAKKDSGVARQGGGGGEPL